MSGSAHVISTQLAMLVHKRSLAGLSKYFFDDTILEFMGKTSEASEDEYDTLFEVLLFDWETMPPAPPIPAIGEPHPCFAHATLQELEHLRAKNMNANTAKSTGTR